MCMKNPNALAPEEITVLRAGLLGPWRDLVPLILGGFANHYVRRGRGLFPAVSAQGESSLFVPSLFAGQDTGIRQRALADPVPAWCAEARRSARFYVRPQSAPYRRYGIPGARSRWSPMGEEVQRELSEKEITLVREYQPRTVISAEYWPPIRDFVVEAMLKVGGYSVSSPHTYMSNVVAYVDWCRRVMGVELNREEIFDHDLIAYYSMNAAEGHARSTRGSLRAKLLWVGDHLIPGGVRPRTLERVGRTPATAPYRVDEIALLKMWASSQTTAYLRHACWTALVFGLGAGLVAAELAELKREDVHETAEGVIVTITGGRSPREVVILAEWEDFAMVLVESVEPGAYVFKPHAVERPYKIVGYALSKTKQKPSGLEINLTKMRMTWMVRLLNAGCPVPVFIKAAGLKGMTGLERIIPYLDDATAQEAAKVMRASNAERKARYREENAEYCKQIRRDRYQRRKSFAEQVSGP